MSLLQLLLVFGGIIGAYAVVFYTVLRARNDIDDIE